ncbi:MAG: hypothetical protein MI757_04130 [Pirellulales bacterium]|nr:hypothetical protein [Pirellulales bacterium]
MATGTLKQQSSSQPRDAQAERYQDYIEDQLDRTSSYVRTVDIAVAMTTLLIGVFVIMLTAAVVDHWIIPGGLGGFGRWVFFIALAGGAGYYTTRFVLPLFIRRINPLYAARAIEQSEPTLKNSLINFLMLRSQPKNIHKGVFRAVESRAARDLTHVSVDTAVDRSHLIKLGYVLIAMVILFAAYVFISPKSPLPSIGRVLAPWGDIERPSRVEIELYPHSPKEVFRGQHLSVSALVHGLDDGEEVTLYWSTADGQIANEPIVMYQEKDDPRHRCTIPAEKSQGLRQDIQYWVVAGDARTATIDVPVLEELFITVDDVRYEYPEYTGKEPTVQSHGDIRAVEGTIVTISSTANQPIKSAHLDYDCDGTIDELASSIDGNRAEFRIPLSLMGRDRQIEQSTYWVRFFTEQDRENTKPVKHRIEVLPDWPPEVNIVAPQKDRIEVLPTGRVLFRLRGRDNDYGLVHVGFVIEKDGKQLATVPLLAEKDTPWLGESWIERSWVFEPAKYKLVPGDVVQVFAEVIDNKQPRGQKRASRQKIEVVVLEPPKPKDKQDQAPPQDPNKAKQPMNPEQRDKPDMGDPSMQPNEQPGQGDQPEQGDQKQDGMGDGMKNAGEGGMGEQENGGMQNEPMDGGQKGMGSEGGTSGGGEKGTDGDAKPKEGMGMGEGDSSGMGRKSDDPNATPSDQPSSGDGTGGPQDRPVNPNDDREVIDRINRHRDQQNGAGKPKPGEKSSDGMSGSSGSNQPGDMGTKPEQDMGMNSDGGMADGGGEKMGSEGGMSDPGMNNPEQPGNKAGDPMGTGEKPDGTGGMDPMSGAGEKKPMGTEDMSGGTGMKPDDQRSGDSPKDGAGNSSSGMKPGDKKPKSEGMDSKPTAMGDPSQQNKGMGMGEQKNDGNVDQKKKGQGSQADDEGHGKRDGEGTAGSSTSKDDGAGMSNEKGMGETSDMAGDDKKAMGESGKSDKSKQGNGSRRDGTGDKKGGKPTDNPKDGTSPMEDDGMGGEPSKSPGDGESGKADKRAKDGKPNGFGGDREGTIRNGRDDGPDTPSEDKAVPDKQRRDYARKRTELALEHIEKELAKSKSDLFDKDNGLTREQGKAWAERMRKLLKEAKNSGNRGKAQEKLDQTLDNLGIRPQRSTVGRGTTARDRFRDVHRGVDIPPPAEFADQVRAYKKGASSGQ